MSMNARHARDIRAGLELGSILAADTIARALPRTIAIRWLATNPTGHPQRTIRAARRTYARTLARYAHTTQKENAR